MKIDSCVESDNRVELFLSGTIDEDADFNSIPGISKNLLLINLSKVSIINSCGIRDWVRWTKTLPSHVQVHIDQCPRFIIDQINILQGFLPPKSLVLSFYVPYFCDDCNAEKQILFKREEHFKVATADTEAFVDYDLEVLCDQCKTAMSMDVIPAKFFKFLGIK